MILLLPKCNHAIVELKERGQEQMPKNSEAKIRAVRKYNEKNYSQVTVHAPKNFCAAFKAKCKEKGVSQAEVLKKAMQDFIDEV